MPARKAGDGFVEQSIGMVRNDLSNTSLAEYAPKRFDDQIIVLEPARPGGTRVHNVGFRVVVLEPEA